MSSTKKNLYQYYAFSAQSVATSQTSPPINIFLLDNIGVQVDVLTGTPSGTIAVQVSYNYNPSYPLNAGTWVTVGLNSSTPMSQVITSGSPTPIVFDMPTLSAPWMQIVYTASSGSGTISAVVTGKMI